MSRVCWSPSTRPREVIISQTYSPAPCSAHRRRYAALVMPAIGASTTGVSTTSDPRVSEVGSVRGMRTLSDAPHRSPKCGVTGALGSRPGDQPWSALRGLLRLRGLVSLGALLRRLRADRGELARPGDRVEVLGGTEADGGQVAVLGREVDQARLHPVSVLELGRERLARARLEGARERRGLDQGVVAVDDVERHRPAAEVGPADVLDRRVHEVGRRGQRGLVELPPLEGLGERGLLEPGDLDVEHADLLLARLVGDDGVVADLERAALGGE